DLASAVAGIKTPAVLKSAGFGYDGKGQVRIAKPEEAEAAWSAIGRVPAVLEAFITFEKEISVVAARGADGSYTDWGVIENTHQRHILDVAFAPAAVAPEIETQARGMARAVLEKLD